MKGTRKLPDIGTDAPAWAQTFMVAVKQMLTPPAFPQGDKILLYNASTRLIDWVSLSTTITVSDDLNAVVTVPPAGVTPPPFDDMELDYPVGAVALTTGVNPNTLYGVGIWSAITCTLCADAVASGSGSSTPSSPVSSVQYNNAGSFGGFGLTDGQAVKFTVDNPTLSGDSTYRYGLNVTATYDSSTVDPAFANQDGISVELIALNGQNQYGGGTNAKESFFDLQNSMIAYASGQHFNLSNTLYHFGMGDAFSESFAIYTAGGISAQGDEGTGLWTTGFTHYVDATETTISTVVTPATISTTLTQSVTASRTAQTVTVASTTGVSVDQWVTVDYNDGYNIEAVKITAVGAGTLTGIFRSNHGNGDPITPATVLTIDSGFGFGQGRPVINLSASSYSTGTATPAAGSSTVTGAGTSWSDSMVGGDSRLPGYISFTEDNVDMTSYGSADILKGWYPITAVSSGTSLTFVRLDVLGSAGFPSNTHVSGASAYTIRPGAQILMFDGGIGTIVLETNSFTWTAGQTIECAHSVNNNWGGLYLRFTPLMPGRYDHGILLRNNGQFSMTAGLIVDAIGPSPRGWTTGVDVSGALNGVYLAGNVHSLTILQDSTYHGDLFWTSVGGSNGPSISGNTYLGDGSRNLMLSADGTTYPPYDSGAEAYPSVLSLNKNVNELRWNGFTSLYAIDAASSTYGILYGLGTNDVGTIYRQANTSFTSPTALQGGDKLGRIYFQGYGTSYATGAKIQADATDNWSGTNNGARLSFLTTPNTTATAVEHLAIENSGLITFGGATSSFPALKRSSAELHVRLGDDSNYASLHSFDLMMEATGLIRFGGTSSSFPAFKRSSAEIHARLADDSDYATVRMAAFVASFDAYARQLVALGDSGGVAATITISASSNTTVSNTYLVNGGQTAGTVNTGWIKIYVGTATAWVPYWANATP